MEEKNLFLIEFGEGMQRQSGFMSMNGPSVKPIYVVARDYNEAAKKASYYLETKLEELQEKETEDVITGDGSLKIGPPPVPEEIKIIGLKHISEVIW